MGRWISLIAALPLLLGVAATGGAEELAPLPPHPAGLPWPTRTWPEGPPRGVDPVALDDAVDALFREVGRSGVPNTRALLAVQHGRVVLERYAEGFGPRTRFHSWSMAKSVTQALLARQVHAGALSIEAPAPVPDWQGEGDPRAALTIRNLIHMDTGLDNADGFGGDPADAFVARLLFSEGSRDVVAYAAAPGLADPPGTRWSYSTGTTMILASVVGGSVGGGKAGLRRFAREELFGPIGADSALLEFDAAGNFLGGGFVWARARDWARFGYLYLRDGLWDGRRLLPEGWVDFSRTPAPAAGNGSYGAHFWLNHPPADRQPPQLLPGGPRSAFAAVGNSGQYVLLVPTRDLVLVRLGELASFEDWADLTRSLAAIVATFPAIAAETAAPE